MKHSLSMLKVAIAIIPAIAIAGQAQAEGGAFTSLDVDQNGSISVEEAASNELLSKEWGNVDVDQNGNIEAAEFARFEELLQPAEPAKEMIEGSKY